MRALVVVDNSVSRSGLLAEHGWSVLVEAGGKRILLDGGQRANVFLNNTELLGVELSELDAVVLSHGHYDHAAGILQAVSRSKGKVLYAHPSAFSPRYAVEEGKAPRYVGLKWHADDVERVGGKFVAVEGLTEIFDGIFVSGPIPRREPFEVPDPELKIKRGEGLETDPVEDDLALFVKEGDGIMVVTGCAHSGIVNTVRFAAESLGGEVKAIIGGTHLMGADEARVEATAKALEEIGVGRIFVGHCTGLRSAMQLRQLLGEKVEVLTVGEVVEV